MKAFINSMRRLIKDERGLETVEYAVAGALIVAVAVGVWTALGGAVADKITELTDAINGQP